MEYIIPVTPVRHKNQQVEVDISELTLTSAYIH